MAGVGISAARMSGGHSWIPTGVTLVSSDSHLSLSRDIFFERADRSILDRMPRIWWDAELGIWNMGIGFKPIFPPTVSTIIKSIEDRPGSHDLAARIADLDAEGISMEIAFPQSLQFYFGHRDFEAREHIFRIYNQYIAELGAVYPGRFYGVGIPVYWNPDKFERSLDEIRALGLKTYVLPINPHTYEDGEPIYYASERMEPVWSAAEKARLPLCFHIGENLGYGGRGSLGNAVLNSMIPFRKNLGELIFGGILDQYPKLKIVFAEANISWVPSALQDAEMIYDSFAPLLEPKPQMRPTDYWARNCYATFMHDPVGLKLIDHIGADHIMWAHDYPHNEGTMGYTSAAVRSIFDSLPAEDARMVVGATAASVFNLP
jgi:predicted TIM-barrel fold metal-dependent hydrolase